MAKRGMHSLIRRFALYELDVQDHFGVFLPYILIHFVNRYDFQRH